MLNYVNEQKDGAYVMKLRGNLDALTVPEVRPAVEDLIAKGGVRVVVDLSDLTVIDSSGVALIVSLFKRLRALGGTIRVAGVNGQPREIFHFLRLDQSLPISATVDDALAAG
jgi:anti-sigma B factor antagonist